MTGRKAKISDFHVYSSHLKNKSGIEIAGPSKIFSRKGTLPIYPIALSIDDFSFERPPEWGGRALQGGQTYKYSRTKRKGYQFIGDAVDLSTLAHNTYDFVLASHVIEHIANPLKAMSEWLRVLKDNGNVVLVVPHKDGTFDHRRKVTRLSHLIKDFNSGVSEHDDSHLDDILSSTDIGMDPAIPDREFLERRAKLNYVNRCMHHHVFKTETVIKIFDHMKLQIIALDIVLPFNIIILGRKVPWGQNPDNRIYTDVNAAYKRDSPFPSDRSIDSDRFPMADHPAGI